ncbi:MAG: hypothetical protein ACKV2Q_02860 [Planctomycetaceae bacterium]
MVHTIEGVLEVDGSVRLLQPIQTTSPRRALVLILEEPSAALPSETAILSERSLATDWNRAEEDAAWSHLQPAKS